MGDLARRYPEDADAATLYGDAMMNLRRWNYWTSDGRPQPGTADIVAALERAIARDSTNPGACHLYIHAVESSPDPSRAVPCAERLASLMPGAGHLVHMPAHIYMVVGRYGDAVTANEHAAHTDAVYIEGQHPQGFYPLMYYPHNLHFLTIAATMLGNREEALRTSRRLVARVTPDLAAVPPLEMFVPTPLFVMLRFGLWPEILAEPAPAAEMRYARGEPPAWPLSVRQSLGAVLLAVGRATDAEAVYRADLRKYPANGWSLYGLERALRARRASAAADSVRGEFARAWARADVQLTASRF